MVAQVTTSKRFTLIVLLIIAMVLLTACGEHYPVIRVDPGFSESYCEISVGNKYQYDGFDTEKCDGGIEVTLAFTERRDSQ